MDCVEVRFTIDDSERADAIVDALLAGGLVACGQRSGPVESRYWWKGALERAEEWSVCLKTTAELAPDVVEAVGVAHPYETPEIVVVELAGGSGGYLEWIRREAAGHR